jgi:multisubunit Na+/H+ antiporter MnhB subunit
MTKQKSAVLVFLFYTGLTTSFLSFLTLLDTIFHKSLDAAKGGGLSSPQLIPFVNIRGGLPIGALLLTGITLFVLMHLEVRFLRKGMLSFDTSRTQKFYVLAAVCILSVIVTMGDFIEIFYENGWTSDPETHLYGIIKLLLASFGIGFALFSASPRRLLLRWNWLREAILLLLTMVAMAVMSSYFSPKEVEKAHQDVRALNALYGLETRNIFEIRNKNLSTILRMDNPPETLYISKNGRTVKTQESPKLFPISLTVITPEHCVACIHITSRKVLRKHLYPNQKNLSVPAGKVCVHLPEEDDDDEKD